MPNSTNAKKLISIYSKSSKLPFLSDFGSKLKINKNLHYNMSSSTFLISALVSAYSS